jgi:predicted acyl esterase
MGRWGLKLGFVAGALALVTAGIVPASDRAEALPATFTSAGSVEQVYVTHATPGDAIELHDASDVSVASGTVDDLGSFLFRDVVPGDGYTVVERHAGGDQVSTALHVMTRTETPPQSFYDNQDLVDGFQYITMRDGTKLAATVKLPGPAANGPYPTVIEYSGYDPANPNAPQPSTLISQVIGWATVGVNIRGTGCSGGAFNFFEPLQALDGYDVVEAVASQPWVMHGKPGMVGISYPGIAQTFVGPTQPPHLAALAPLSVVADTYRSLADPGGIPNSGFPRNWAEDRDNNAEPYGQGWEQGIVDAGGAKGAQCAENQLLRRQNVKLVEGFDDHPYREPVNLADELAPELLDANVNVPVFIGGAWQDEQTGGDFSKIWKNLTIPPGKQHLFGTNGTHVDSLVAELNRWYEFIEFYVAQRIPKVPAGVRAIAPIIFETATGIKNVQLEPDRFTDHATYASALADYESEQPVRILFENGAGNKTNLGAPFGTYEMRFPSWPPPNAVATTWFLQPDQKLSKKKPTPPDHGGRASTAYTYDPDAKPKTNFTGSTSAIWAAHPTFDWRPLPLGKALAFDSGKFHVPTVMAGTGSVDLWVRSSATDTDLEVTLTELRPDGKEIYIQNGWLRASHRALDSAHSTALAPVHPHTSASAEPLPAGEFVPARVALFPFAHIFRPGSRLRISVEAPNGNRPFWSFAGLPDGSGVVNEIGHSIGRPSKIVLPVIPNAPAPPAALPECGSVRGQPCRDIASKGAPTNVKAVANGSDAIVSWDAPAPRSGDALESFVVSALPGNVPVQLPPTTTSVVFPGGTGSYNFTVTATYASHTTVAATPSNVVVLDGSEPTTSTTTTVAPTTTTTVSVEGSTAPTTLLSSGTATGSGSGSSSLPFTGGTFGATAAFGAAAAGLGLVLARRRRKASL